MFKGQWSSGYNRRKNTNKSDEDLDGIFDEIFSLFFYLITTASPIVLKSLSVVNSC